MSSHDDRIHGHSWSLHLNYPGEPKHAKNNVQK